jgi:SAM-dependent methyltransferase
MNRTHRWICRSALWRYGMRKKVLPWALAGVSLGDEVLEVGPGPGVTTDVLRLQCRRLTAVEVDGDLASKLADRLAGTNVTVVHADATALPFPEASFTGAVSFTMLHHVPSASLQDRLFGEVYRTLKPGGLFAGTDSLGSWGMTLLHVNDTMVLVNPETLALRLARVGFADIAVAAQRRVFRFCARKPVLS